MCNHGRLTTSPEVWLKAPPMAIKVPIAKSVCSSCPSIRFTALHRAVLVEWPTLKACWSLCNDLLNNTLTRIYLSTSLSTRFSRKDVRLMGRKSLREGYSILPAFGIKTTLMLLHAPGTYIRTRLALASFMNRPMMGSLALCKRTGYMPSGPGDFVGWKTSGPTWMRSG